MAFWIEFYVKCKHFSRNLIFKMKIYSNANCIHSFCWPYPRCLLHARLKLEDNVILETYDQKCIVTLFKSYDSSHLMGDFIISD